MISVSQALLATVLFALVIFATRLFPFALFSRRDPPKLLRFIEQSIPPAVMAILVIYSLKDIPWAETGGRNSITARIITNMRRNMINSLT